MLKNGYIWVWVWKIGTGNQGVKKGESARTTKLEAAAGIVYEASVRPRGQRETTIYLAA